MRRLWTLLIPLALVTCQKTPSREEALNKALVNVYQKSHLYSEKYIRVIQDPRVHVIVLPDNLEGSTLGRTSIKVSLLDNEPIVEARVWMDVDKIRNHQDHLEPLIAHEIFHIWDACYQYDSQLIFSAAKFMELVELARHQEWADRPHEKKAVSFENRVRAELISKYSEFKHMARTREQASQRYFK